jgi:hypothetical protein
VEQEVLVVVYPQVTTQPTGLILFLVLLLLLAVVMGLATTQHQP